MASSTKKEKVLNSISPAALVAIVIMNLLLIYLMFETLNTQSQILKQIKDNTEIALTNQELGLNATTNNQDILNKILDLEVIATEIFHDVNSSEPIDGSGSNLP